MLPFLFLLFAFLFWLMYLYLRYNSFNSLWVNNLVHTSQYGCVYAKKLQLFFSLKLSHNIGSNKHEYKLQTQNHNKPQQPPGLEVECIWQYLLASECACIVYNFKWFTEPAKIRHAHLCFLLSTHQFHRFEWICGSAG